jgi:hypothetical protein
MLYDVFNFGFCEPVERKAGWQHFGPDGLSATDQLKSFRFVNRIAPGRDVLVSSSVSDLTCVFAPVSVRVMITWVFMQVSL